LRHYELVVVLSPILSPEDSSGSWERIKEIISQDGGDITKEEQWGMRRLAYPIRKAGQTFLEGNYLLTRFSTDKVVPRELEGYLRLAESVLRFLVVKSEAPKPVVPPVEEPVTSEASQPETPEAVAVQAEEPGTQEPVAAQAEEPEAPEPVAVQAGEPEAHEEAGTDQPGEPEAQEPVTAQAEELEAQELAVAQAEEPEAPEPVADQVEEPNVNVVEEAGTDQPRGPPACGNDCIPHRGTQRIGRTGL
jgi:small subunit ribosomal protein S6